MMTASASNCLIASARCFPGCTATQRSPRHRAVAPSGQSPAPLRLGVRKRFESLGRVADRAAAAGAPLVYGPGRHGPGNNHFIYFKDPDGFLLECCSDLAQVGPGSSYELGRKWTVGQTNLWGPSPPPAFLLAGRPRAPSATGTGRSQEGD
jgi:hypothetical protein